MRINVRGVEYKLTNHAKMRMKRRGIKLSEIVDTLANIKIRRQYTREEDGEVRIMLSNKNNITVIVTPENVIVTVYTFSKEYHKNKSKNKNNKSRRQIKRNKGNRIKH